MKSFLLDYVCSLNLLLHQFSFVSSPFLSIASRFMFASGRLLSGTNVDSGNQRAAGSLPFFGHKDLVSYRRTEHTQTTESDSVNR